MRRRVQNAIRLLTTKSTEIKNKKSGSDKAAADDDDDDDDDDPYLLGDTNSSSVVDEAIDPEKPNGDFDPTPMSSHKCMV